MTTKSQLINALSDDLGVTKKLANAFLNSLGRVLQSSLATSGEGLIPGVGKLKVRERAARSGRNPRTGESLNISARKTVRLASTKSLKAIVNTAPAANVAETDAPVA